MGPLFRPPIHSWATISTVAPHSQLNRTHPAADLESTLMSFVHPTFDQPEPSAYPPVKQKRIWPWVVIPVGCFSVILLCCGGFTLLGVGLLGAMKSSEPYRIGLERAKSNPEVKEALGEPIDASFIVQGSIVLNNDDGNVDITFPISGSKGAGQVHVQGTKTNGVWTYEEMSITLDNGPTYIDLSDGSQ